VANISRAWIGSSLTAGSDVVVTSLLTHHIFSMTAKILTMMSLGCNNLLVTSPKDFESLCQNTKKKIPQYNRRKHALQKTNERR
jgi:hypothetical protein